MLQIDANLLVSGYMRLFLLRHAKSSWNDETLSDFERPLNKRGLRDAPVMAKRLLDADLLPETLLCSPALRTRQTADLIMPVLGIPAAQRHFVASLYEASPGTVLEGIAEHGRGTRSLMIVAHNPAVEYLATIFNGGQPLTMATCAVCVFDLHGIEHWGQISAATSRLIRYDYPKAVTGRSAPDMT